MNRGSDGGVTSGVDCASAASMRPRFMNRGSDRKALTQGQRIGCFNEAPIHESGKCRRVDIL